MNEPADDNPKNAGEDASTNPSKVEERLAAIPEQKENKTAAAVPKRTENSTSNKGRRHKNLIKGLFPPKKIAGSSSVDNVIYWPLKLKITK